LIKNFLNSKHRSFHINSVNKSSSQLEGSQEIKQPKDMQNVCTASNSSSQSSRSSRDVEAASESSSPIIQKPNENIPNTVCEASDDAHDNENLYKVSEEVESSAYDPVTAALSDLKGLRINEEFASSNSDMKLKNSKHDITFTDSTSPEHSKSLLLDSLKSYVNSAVSLLN
jgi:hypothetical protein